MVQGLGKILSPKPANPSPIGTLNSKSLGPKSALSEEWQQALGLFATMLEACQVWALFNNVGVGGGGYGLWVWGLGFREGCPGLSPKPGV